MKGDLLHRRLIANELQKSGLVFYLPMNSDDEQALTDQISGNFIDDTTITNLNFDSNLNMFKFTSGSSLNTYCFRIKTGFSSTTFNDNGEYTVIAKCKLQTSTQKYAAFITLKQATSSTFNKNYASVQALNLIQAPSMSTNTNGYSQTDVKVYATSHSSENRQYFTNDQFAQTTASSGHNGKYFTNTDVFDGYLYFGACFDNQWQYNITYYMSDLMIFNRRLTHEEIFNVNSLLSFDYGDYLSSSGTPAISINWDDTSADVEYTANLSAKIYNGEDFNFQDTGTLPARLYNVLDGYTWDVNTNSTNKILDCIINYNKYSQIPASVYDVDIIQGGRTA